MTPLVSVIIPIYNTPTDYLKRCIESVAYQNYNAIECILIDDGSNQKTAEALDQIVKDLKKEVANFGDEPVCNENYCICPQSRFLVIHQKNGGVSRARNVALRKATGDYICFLDADDYFHRDFIQKLVKKAEAGYNMVACNFTRVDPKNEELKTSENPKGDYENEDVWKYVNTGFIWNKLYKADLIKKEQFKEGMTLCEDLLFLNQILEKEPKCFQIEDSLYFHTVDPNSTTAWLSADQYQQAIDAVTYQYYLPFIQQDEELKQSKLNYLAEWEIKHLDMLLAEGRKKEFKGALRHYRTCIAPNINNAGKLVTISTEISKLPRPLVRMYFRVFHGLRVLRLQRRKRVNK